MQKKGKKNNKNLPEITYRLTTYYFYLFTYLSNFYLTYMVKNLIINVMKLHNFFWLLRVINSVSMH